MKSEELKKIVEEYVENPDYLFGKTHCEEMLNVLCEDEQLGLDETKFREALEWCEFKDPNKTSLLAFFALFRCSDIVERISTNKWVGKIWMFFNCIYSVIAYIEIIRCIVNQEVTPLLLFIGLTSAVHGFTYYLHTKIYNNTEIMICTVMKCMRN